MSSLAPPTRHVYLVPGFFGFTSLGDVSYFRRVVENLTDALSERGFEAKVIECATQPTGSIRRRTARLAETVFESGGLDADELYFVGHSTGGLDARLLVSPNVRLRDGDIPERIGARTRSVVCLSTPHHGTPLANFFTTLSGRHMLELSTALASTAGGRYTIFALARALRLIARADDTLGRKRTFLDVWGAKLFERITLSGDDALWAFIRDVSTDQGAILQLTPESMNLFDATVCDRPTVRYASLLTAAPPAPRAFEAKVLLSPAKTALASVFTVLYNVARIEHRHYPYPHPDSELLARLRKAAPFTIDSRTNDGIVPTLSQIHGRVLGLVVGDHLDVVGQYDTGEPHADWLPSGAGYDDARFLKTWDLVADEIVAAAEHEPADGLSPASADPVPAE